MLYLFAIEAPKVTSSELEMYLNIDSSLVSKFESG